MKTRYRLHALNLIGALFLALCCSVFSGCTTAAGTIDAASTKVEIRTGKYKSMSIVLPKELDASKLRVGIDPKTGQITVDADKLKSSSQAIIESSGKAQADSIAALSKTVSDVVPQLARLATMAIAPSSIPAVLADEATPTPPPLPPPPPRQPDPEPVTIPAPAPAK